MTPSSYTLDWIQVVTSLRCDCVGQRESAQCHAAILGQQACNCPTHIMDIMDSKEMRTLL